MAQIIRSYATAEDGTVLNWVEYPPTAGWRGVGTPGTGPWPFAVIIHGGGFKEGDPFSSQQSVVMAQDYAAQGFFVVSIYYRVDTKRLPGQPSTTGYVPDQVNDCKRAILAARADARCDGRVLVGGGSAGASHSFSVCAETETVAPGPTWTAADRPLGGVLLSGPYNFSERFPDQNVQGLANDVAIYCQCDQNDFATLDLKSPIAKLTANVPPLLIYNGTVEAMPYHQQLDLIARLDALGVTNYETHTNTDAPVNRQHAFSYWPTIRDHALAWSLAIVEGSMPPPPPPDSSIPTGVAALIQGDGAIDQATLDQTNNAAISLRSSWARIALTPEPSGNDWSYFRGQISRCSAAGKKAILLVQTGSGSVFHGGNKPNWLYTLIGGGKVFSSATTTTGSATVTSAAGGVAGSSLALVPFDSGDLHRRITGPGIPDNTYIGTVTSGTSIKLSSSSTTQVDVLATETHTSTAQIHVFDATGALTFSNDLVVPGTSYSYLDTNDNGGTGLVTIPVFWDPIYLAKKRKLIAELGTFIAGLVPLDRAAIAGIRIAYANARTDDWFIPTDDTGPESPDFTISQLQRWLHLPGDVAPGAGYTTQKMIDTAVTTTPADAAFTGGTITHAQNLLQHDTAGFTPADLGKTITGATFAAGTTITIWVNSKSVMLSASPADATGVAFTIKQRVTGLFDVARASCPGQFTAHAIGTNGPLLDKTAADAADDPDADNFLARSVNTLLQARFPAKIVTQELRVSAKQAKAPGTGTVWQLLYEIGTAGNPVAGQDLWRVYQDNSLRMNGGTRNDLDYTGPPPIPQLTDDEIRRRAGERAAGYGMAFLEVYEADVLGLPDAVQYIHDLLHMEQGGGPPPPPPPPPIGTVGPPKPFIRPARFLDEVIYGIADLLGLDRDNDVSPSRVRRWIGGINRHVEYIWDFYFWPELYLTEERAFAPVWNANDAWQNGDRLYWIGNGYYDVIGGDPPIGTLPSDTSYFVLTDLTTLDRAIPTLQRCRRRLGDIDEVYGRNPHSPACTRTLDWQMSERGLEVPTGLNTVFVRYRIPAFIYTGEYWNSATAYRADALVLWSGDGEVYRANSEAGSIAPGPDSLVWNRVVFPKAFAPYVIYMTAADDAEDAQTASRWEAKAENFLVQAVDRQLGQGVRPPRYRLFGRSNRFRHGLPGYDPSAVNATVPPTELVNTISDVCVTEWGDAIPVADSGGGGGGGGGGAPVISGILPSSGPVGTTFQIQGVNFGGITSVTVNGIACTSVTVVSNTKITAVVGASTTSGHVVITGPQGSATSPVDFTVTADAGMAPTISGITPTSGPVGTSFVILGDHFALATAVKINGVNVASFVINNDTHITAIVDASNTTGAVTVVNPTGTGTGPTFTVTLVAGLSITSFTPTTGDVGSSVVITGTGFTGATRVRIGGVNVASFTVDSATQITAVVGASDLTGTIAVTGSTGAVATSIGIFTVTGVGIITSFTPHSGPTGTSVVITGRGFTGAGYVRLNGVDMAGYVVDSDTQITATVAAGNTSGKITVSTGAGVLTAPGNFTKT